MWCSCICKTPTKTLDGYFTKVGSAVHGKNIKIIITAKKILFKQIVVALMKRQLGQLLEWEFGQMSKDRVQQNKKDL